jgi:phosphopantothenoylcysteine decarboxylase/phosphopantothenate--cysteine ligase
MASIVNDKRILLIVGGGIAAYKSLELTRELRRRGAHVRAILTKAGEAFVTPLSLAALTGATVHGDLFSLTEETEMGHIELSRSADLVVVAPATADLIAKAAHGLANDLASTTLLATDTRVLMAPAMNVRMWLSAQTQRNVARLAEDGIRFIGPNEGEMACGEYGPGRMAEPAEIVAEIERLLTQGSMKVPLPTAARPTLALTRPLAGKRVVVTSGPTHEPIDPVRYIANRSSGKQGHAIARAAIEAGAEVVLVSGPVGIAPPAGVDLVNVETARQMLEAVEAALPCDVGIFAAAVADWRVDRAADQKLKKDGSGPPALALAENPDILATIARRKGNRPPLMIGFAAETTNVVDYAKAKRLRKGCDWIVANDVSPGTGIMGGDSNAVHLITADRVESWPRMDKDAVAERLVLRIATALEGRR